MKTSSRVANEMAAIVKIDLRGFLQMFRQAIFESIENKALTSGDSSVKIR